MKIYILMRTRDACINFNLVILVFASCKLDASSVLGCHTSKWNCRDLPQVRWCVNCNCRDLSVICFIYWFFFGPCYSKIYIAVRR
jgi:hypothetical protein